MPTLGWPVLGLASAIFAALVAIFAKIGLETAPPIASTAFRALVMVIGAFLAAAVSGELTKFGEIDRRAWLFIVLSGIAGAASWIANFAALKLGGADQVTALDRLSIVFVVLLAATFLGEELTWARASGAALIVAGALLIAR